MMAVGGAGGLMISGKGIKVVDGRLRGERGRGPRGKTDLSSVIVMCGCAKLEIISATCFVAALLVS